ncbi:arylacetamide deacetylase [Colletotrichum tofieldiae]|uniref:Arylacetamide deacetylase n=1 Tax=Colletotrichum tofieldiae TaxID=708197 RepID=A0A166Z9G2_9PEZI|nr:arylacetamide deacetylase [Colletotrichum tofieldiae]GKT55856.1 arylacetamide deacetylase [Colletotrichum tofieldiae]GKT79306.1 arylacetamide deacetylase [Colletotrichum tofieldiae]
MLQSKLNRTVSNISNVSRASKGSKPASKANSLVSSVAGTPDDEYDNPLESVSRWRLTANAVALRSGAAFAFGLQNLSAPVPPAANRAIWLDSTLSEWSGTEKIRVDVWLPPTTTNRPTGKVPAVINFHGGGFVLGQGTDDARWAGAVATALNAVVFSVNYRLAPGYPFPTPVEDSTDSILQIVARAEEFRIDTQKVFLSGFSAGGTLALASWNILQDPDRWGYKFKFPVPDISGIVLFYPLLDWTLTRPQKRQTCGRPDMTLPKSMTDLFDASYVYPPRPRSERGDPRLSPGLMTDEMIDRLPPVHLCMCEFDMLLLEGQSFAERARSRGRRISTRVVKAEKHAWDKPPPFTPKESVMIEYNEAITAVKEWLENPDPRLE